MKRVYPFTFTLTGLVLTLAFDEQAGRLGLALITVGMVGFVIELFQIKLTADKRRAVLTVGFIGTVAWTLDTQFFLLVLVAGIGIGAMYSTASSEYRRARTGQSQSDE